MSEIDFVKLMKMGQRLSSSDWNILIKYLQKRLSTTSGYDGRKPEPCSCYTTEDIPAFSIFPLKFASHDADSLENTFTVGKYSSEAESGYLAGYFATNGNQPIKAPARFVAHVIDTTHDFPVRISSASTGDTRCGFADGSWSASPSSTGLYIVGKCPEPFGENIYFVRRSLETCCDKPQHIFVCLDETLEPDSNVTGKVWQTGESVTVYAPPIMCYGDSIPACTMVLAIWFEQYDHYYAIIRGDGCNCSCPTSNPSSEETSPEETSPEETSPDSECNCLDYYKDHEPESGHALVSGSYETPEAACEARATYNTSSEYQTLRSTFGGDAPIVVQDPKDNCRNYVQWAYYSASTSAGTLSNALATLQAVFPNAKYIDHKMSQHCVDCTGGGDTPNNGNQNEEPDEDETESSEGGVGNGGGGGGGGTHYAKIWHEKARLTHGLAPDTTQVWMYAYVDETGEAFTEGLTLYVDLGTFNDVEAARAAVDAYFTESEQAIIAWGQSQMIYGDGEGNLWAQGYDIPWEHTFIDHDYKNGTSSGESE